MTPEQPYQKIAIALLRSPEWQAWYQYARENNLFDVDETAECGWMSDNHFRAFIEFIKDQARVEWEKRESELVQQIKANDASWMALKNDYSELARTIGAKGDPWFGDPLCSHKELLDMAKTLRQKDV